MRSSQREPVLLSREQFVERVRERDHGRCVICGRAEADGVQLDVHHILERRLFDDGGYYVENGALVCGGDGPESCHRKAELTLISPDELRKAAGIELVMLPDYLDDELTFTKWGDPVWSDGSRTPGPLFYEEPVQKVLKQAGVLHLYRGRFRYPRTPHAPWSPNRGTDGDHVLEDLSRFEGQEVVVTLKLDGESVTATRDYIHARSPDSGYHHTRTWVQALHGRIAHELSPGMRLCGENLWGTHAIKYYDLPSYFFLYAVFNEQNRCLSWDDLCEWAELLGLETVPLIYRGPWDLELIKNLEPEPEWADEAEGYVVRLASSFSYWEFSRCVFKSVRKGHVKDTVKHWRTASVEANALRSE